MLTLHSVDVFVAITVYVPGIVSVPKLIAALVPATGEPIGAVPLNNWYLTPASELNTPTGTPAPPAQYAPPPVRLYGLGNGAMFTIAEPSIVIGQARPLVANATTVYVPAVV